MKKRCVEVWQADEAGFIKLFAMCHRRTASRAGSIDMNIVFFFSSRRRHTRFGSDWKRKKELRAHIKEPQIHPDADATWQ